MKLNLGCGTKKLDNFINLDIDKSVNPDVCWDLDQFPYPFNDNSFDFIYSNHVLEHLDPTKKLRLFEELYRISRPNGLIELRMPHSSSNLSNSIWHTASYSGFTFREIVNIEKGNASRFKPRFKIKELKLKWSNAKQLKILDKLISFFANLSIRICERFWIHWVGGFDEIHVVLEVIK